MQFTDIRLKMIRLVKKYKKILFIIVLVWGIIFFVNYYIGHRKVVPKATTTYEPHTSIMSSSSSTPSSMTSEIEQKIHNYVEYCKVGDFDEAYKMLSEECREYAFKNNVNEFVAYIYDKIPSESIQYSIQSYSNIKVGNKKVYIYEVKYTPDYLATGLTNETYSYATEKISFYRDDDKNLQMIAGNYIYHNDIKSISENEYLKIDVVDKVVNYSIEKYTVKFTNRSNNIIVIADGAEENEVVLSLNNETRKRAETETIVLEPNQVAEYEFTFSKFVDGDIANDLLFSSIRVMEQYSGMKDKQGNDIDHETIQSEIDNAIAKFSMQVAVKE